MMRSKSGSAGVTLIEMVIAIVVYGMGMTALLGSIDRGTNFSQSALTTTINDSNARKPLQLLTEAISESSISFVDTTMRFTDQASGYGFESDKFPMWGVGLKQCTSPVCGFHTQEDFTLNRRGYDCGFEYRTGMGLQAQVRGKIWPEELKSCPLDGSYLSSNPLLDGLKFFTARGADGSFMTTPGPVPNAAYNRLIFVFPFKGMRGKAELRLYSVSILDLVASGPSYTEGWDNWPPLSPTMVNLFDFGKDGTGDGEPDGSVPVTSATTDADTEVFMVANFEDEPSIIFAKTLGAPGTYPYKEVYVTVNLKTGETYFSASYHESETEWWSASSVTKRPPRVLVTDLTDFAASTAASHPYDKLTNPTGVKDEKLVRISIATTQRLREKGKLTWPYRVDRITLRPRN